GGRAGQRDRLAELAADPGVRGEERAGDDRRLGRGDRGGRRPPAEEEEAAVDADAAAVVGPRPGADAEARAERVAERPRPDERAGERVAEEPEPLPQRRVRLGRR